MQAAVGTVFLNEISYSIVKIEEEAIPLSSGPQDTYYFWAIVGMVMLIFLAALVTYLVQCERYRKRIRELNERGAKQPGWELWKLKEVVKELEMQKTDELIGKMEKQIV